MSYDCTTCPGFCCSYDEITLTEADIDRIAAHLGTTPDDVIVRYTKYGRYHGESRKPYFLAHQRDRHFSSICKFLDTDTRQCTIYDARPQVCRTYPGKPICGYYTFLMFEREIQEDQTYVAVTG